MTTQWSTPGIVEVKAREPRANFAHDLVRALFSDRPRLRGSLSASMRQRFVDPPPVRRRDGWRHDAGARWAAAARAVNRPPPRHCRIRSWRASEGATP